MSVLSLMEVSAAASFTDKSMLSAELLEFYYLSMEGRKDGIFIFILMFNCYCMLFDSISRSI
jgi:hypothetical protein